MKQHLLENKIKHFQYKYYVEGVSEIPDEEFDVLWKDLVTNYPESLLLTKIGSDLEDGFPTGLHLIPMGSQRKATTKEEIDYWVENNKISRDVVVQLKLDGLSLELQYENSELVSAVTRGDGVKGVIVTSNALKMKGVPPKLKTPNFTGSVRGEVLLALNTFREKYSEDFKNPRNTASGFLKALDGKNASDLSFVAYDRSTDQLDSEEGTILWLVNNSFTPVPTTPFKNFNIEDFEKYVRGMIAKRGELTWSIDGLVLKQNLMDLEDRKELIGVDWSISNTTITPVALLDPIDLDGSTVRRASLANMNLVNDMKLKIGDLVIVTKRGDIIPKIEKVHEHCGEEVIKAPEYCPTCGNPTETDSSSRIFCKTMWCPSRLKGNILKWVSTLEVKGFGESLISDLVDKGYVKEVTDLYTMDLQAYLDSTNLKKSTEKAFKKLFNVKEIPLHLFVSGFNLDGFGSKRVKLLVEKGYDTLDKLEAITKQEMVAIPGLGIETYNLFRNEFDYKLPIMLQVANYVTPVMLKKTVPTTSSGLSGHSFCFTGKLTHFKRKDAEIMVIEASGEVKSVTKGLDYLVCADPNSGSSKLKKATALGTKIISEEEFLKLSKEK